MKLWEKLVVTVIAAAALTLLVSMLNAQENKVSKYQPSELQSLKLKVAQQQAQIAQKDLFIAQQSFQTALSLLNQAGEQVKQENQWEAGVVFNPDNLTFIDGPKKVTSSEAK